ncbi:hypothetical protein NQ176_g7913 [Zarea fungicola]|uniref:Uncharacterized protein n=1 Tax=Zarea fungicola TaxID=93591 RepID=A0ACC1MX95_9HYPO|nr:hypothetical protein NQ176_g7913 [Lecanicillium fungicola]
MAGGFPGASVLVQETMGHCVFGAGRLTDCTRDKVRRYFDEGVVPSHETVCEAACDPWGAKCEPNVSIMGGIEEFTRDHRRFPMHV